MTDKVHKLQRASLKNPVKVEVNSKYHVVSSCVQQYHFMPAKYKEVYLVHTLTQFMGQKTIIFTQT